MILTTLCEVSLLAAIAALAAYTIWHDIRHMEIPAIPILALAALGTVAGVAFPLGSSSPAGAALAFALALGLGFATRFYTLWRTGAPAFGGADIALIAGGGAMLGPFLFGPWLLCAVVLALLLLLAGPALTGLRKTDIDGAELNALPFCPALIISAALLWGCARSGLFDPARFF